MVCIIIRTIKIALAMKCKKLLFLCCRTPEEQKGLNKAQHLYLVAEGWSIVFDSR